MKINVTFEIDIHGKANKEDVQSLIETIFLGKVRTASKDCVLTYDRKSTGLAWSYGDGDIEGLNQDLLHSLEECEEVFSTYADVVGFSDMAPVCHEALETARDVIDKANKIYKLTTKAKMA